MSEIRIDRSLDGAEVDSQKVRLIGTYEAGKNNDTEHVMLLILEDKDDPGAGFCMEFTAGDVQKLVRLLDQMKLTSPKLFEAGH